MKCITVLVFLLCPLLVHHGGSSGTVRVPDQQTPSWWLQSGCGHQPGRAQGNQLPLHPQYCVCCSLLQGETERRNLWQSCKIRQKSQTVWVYWEVQRYVTHSFFCCVVVCESWCGGGGSREWTGNSGGMSAWLISWSQIRFWCKLTNDEFCQWLMVDPTGL